MSACYIQLFVQSVVMQLAAHISYSMQGKELLDGLGCKDNEMPLVVKWFVKRYET